MTPDLRDALNEAADLARPTALDPDSLWRESRRSKRRAWALSSLGGLATMLLIALTLLWGLHSTPSPAVTPPAGAQRNPAMPATLYDPRSSDAPQSQSLDIGSTAAVFVPETGGVVSAVSATDGAYRFITLPGYDLRRARIGELNPALALSPDGTHLAYGWHREVTEGSPTNVPGGIRLVDLTTGHITTYAYSVGLSPSCGALSWSPAGRYLVYTCYVHADPSTGVGFQAPVERLDTTSGVQVRVATTMFGNGGMAAVNDEGLVAVPREGGLDVWAPNRRPAIQTFHSMIPNLPSYAGWLDDAHVVISGTDTSSVLYQTVHVQSSASRPAQSVPGSAGRLVGSTGPGAVALWVNARRGAALYTYSLDEGLVQRVTFKGLAPIHELTFATELLQRPSSHLPAPSWLEPAPNRVKQVLPYVAGAGLVLLVGWGVVAKRRWHSFAEDSTID